MMRTVDQKRADALVRIAQHSLGTALAGAVPTPVFELTKQLGIALSDAWMFWDVYKIFYDETLSADRLEDLLGKAGVITITGGAIGYTSIRVTQAVIAQVLSIVPVGGWVVSGLMTGSASAALGLTWMSFVDNMYRTELSLSAPEIRVIPVTLGPEAAPEPRLPRSPDLLPQEAEITEIVDDTPTAPEKIQTEHPDPNRTGVNINAGKYTVIREAIIAALEAGGEMTYKELVAEVDSRIGATFEGSVSWYVTTVKLDLEAKNIVERANSGSPQRLRLV